MEVEPARPAQPGDPFLRRHRRIHGDRAIALSFLGFNPMKALVWSGIVQGFSTPPLMLLILLMTNNRAIMGSG